MPSTGAVAGSCSAAARLRPPVAGRPARAAAGFGWPCRPRVCCSRSERGGRSPAPRGRLFLPRDDGVAWSSASRSVGRPPPPALGTCSRAPFSAHAHRPHPPLAHRRSTRRSSPLSPAGPGLALPALYYCAAVFGPAATPRGQRARRARGRSSPTAMGFARLRWQHLPEACLRSAPLPLAEACAPPLARVGPGPRARARREPLASVPRRWEKQRAARVCLSEYGVLCGLWPQRARVCAVWPSGVVNLYDSQLCAPLACQVPN